MSFAITCNHLHFYYLRYHLNITSRAAPTEAVKRNIVRRAYAVREPNGKRLDKVLRFYCNLSSHLAAALNKWVACTKAEERLRDLFDLSDTRPWSTSTRDAPTPMYTSYPRKAMCGLVFIAGILNYCYVCRCNADS